MEQNEFIAKLRTEIGISNLAFNADNVCRLILEKHLIIDLEWLEGKALFIYASIGSANHLTQAQLLMLLQANAYGQGTGGAMLAIDKNAEEIILHRIYELERLDMPDVIKDLENLINNAMHWKQTLLNGATEDISEDTSIAQLPSNMMLV